MMSHWFTKNNLIVALFCLFFIQGIQASSALSNLTNPSQPQVLTAEDAFKVDASFEGTVVKFSWHIAPQCYLYQESIKIDLQSKPGNTPLIGEANLPAGEKIQDPYFGEQTIYSHDLTVTVDMATYFEPNRAGTLTTNVEYQGCAKSGFCYPPLNQIFKIEYDKGVIKTITLSDHTSAAPTTTETPAATPPTETGPNQTQVTEPAQNKSFLVTVMLFYLAGVLLTFTPCVLPMIPILFVVIVGQGHLSTRRAFTISLCYVLSMAVTYAIAGILVATLGKNLQASLQKPLVLILFSALFFYLGLVQLGIGKVSLPAKWRDWLHNSHSKQESGSYLGAAIMGVLATLIASPCVSAPMIGALSFISQSGNIWLGGSSLFAMGLGMGTILIIIGTLEGKFLPKKGPWMHAINQTFSIILFGLSLWLMDRLLPGPVVLALWGLLLLLAAYWLGTFSLQPNRSGRVGVAFVIYALMLFWGSWNGYDDLLNPLGLNSGQNTVLSNPLARFQKIDSIATLSQEQELALKEERPLMVFFHAEWCAACKHFEHNTLSDNDIQQKLSTWKLAVADVTEYNEANQQLLKKFDLVGPPVVLFFDKKGNELVKYRQVGDISRKEFAAILTQVDKEMQR